MDFEGLIKKIKIDFESTSDKTKVDLIYAFNGTGKTRISRHFMEEENNNYLCFNALFQDNFTWDNDNFILNITLNSWIVKMINEQGIQNQIIDNFQNLYSEEIEPHFSNDNTKVTFNAKTIDGYDKQIKISKAEETLFIWTIFYSFLDLAIAEMHEDKEERSTHIFDELRLIIIDDPVSSIDDARITSVAVSLSNVIDKCNMVGNNLKLKFLVTTHHALFYNVVYNLIHRKKDIKDQSYLLSKKDYKYFLEGKGDSVFGYHLVLKNEILEAIKNDSIKKIHFNMFRIILEKTSNYFGYEKYEDCLSDSYYKNEIIKLVNLYSHGSFPEFEPATLTDNDKKTFKLAFGEFCNYYKMKEVLND